MFSNKGLDWDTVDKKRRCEPLRQLPISNGFAKIWIFVVLDGYKVRFKGRSIKIVDIFALNRPDSRGVRESKVDNVSSAKRHVLIAEKNGAEEMEKWSTRYLLIVRPK